MKAALLVDWEDAFSCFTLDLDFASGILSRTSKVSELSFLDDRTRPGRRTHYDVFQVSCNFSGTGPCHLLAGDVELHTFNHKYEVFV